MEDSCSRTGLDALTSWTLGIANKSNSGLFPSWVTLCVPNVAVTWWAPFLLPVMLVLLGAGPAWWLTKYLGRVRDEL